MFRIIIFWILLLISAVPGGAHAQDGSDKPTEILPDKNDSFSEMPSDQTPIIDEDDTTLNIPLVVNRLKMAGDGKFVIGAVQIEGSTSLSQATFSSAIEPFVGRMAEPNVLKDLARAIANRARAQGFLFASAIIPAQSVGMGVMRVRLDEGVVHKVSVNGTNNRFVKRLFDNLAGKPGMRKDIEQAILLTEDLHGFSIDKTSFMRKFGKGILTIQVSEKAHQAHATLDNYGRQSSGPFRARLEIDWSGVFDDSDWLHSQVLTSPANPQKLLFVSTSYTNMLTDDGKTISVSGGAGRTRQVDSDGEWSKSRSGYANVKLSAPLRRMSSASIWLNLETSFLSVDRIYSDSRPRHDDVVTVTGSVTGNARFAGGKVSGGIAATQGLDILGATRAGDHNASRLDASGQFTKGELWMNWNRKLGSGFSLRTVVNAQIASRPVLSSQEIDLGGPRIGRGFNYSEKSGDQGIAGLAELRRYFDKPVKGVSWAQIYTFVDGGYIDNLRNGGDGGSLMSAGGGIRAGIGKIELSLELAAPIKGMRGNTDRRSPQLNVALGFSF